MKSTLSVLMAVVVALSLIFAAGAEAQQPKSDLPEGWEEPTELPPGAVRLEDVRPRGEPAEAAPAAPPSPAAAPEVAPPPAPAPAAPAAAPPPAPPEAVTEAAPAAPEAPPTPTAEVGPPVSGSDSRTEPVNWRFAPTEATGAPAEPTVAEEAPPPAPAAGEVAAGERVYEPKSDLPEGWAEPTVLPPGSIRLEDVKSPYGPPPAAPPAAPPAPEPAYVPPAAPPTPTPALPEPEYVPPPAPPPPTVPEPEYVPPPPVVEEEPIEEAKEKKPYRPPSRWQQ
jgi:hypothetical protein